MRFAVRWDMMEDAMSNATDTLARRLANLEHALQQPAAMTEQKKLLQSLDESLQDLQSEFADVRQQAEAVLLVNPLTHEFNNFLNAVLLWMAVLELKAPEAAQGESAELRRQAKLLAHAIQSWQRRRPTPTAGRRDLNQAVRSSAATLVGQGGELWDRVVVVEAEEVRESQTGTDGVSLLLEMAADVPPVPGTPLELQSLCKWLIANAVGALAEHGGCIVVHTSSSPSKAVLSVHDSGPHVPDEQLPYLFEPCHSVRPGTSSLELAACHSLAVKRLRGAIRGENRSPRGVAIVVELPIA